MESKVCTVIQICECKAYLSNCWKLQEQTANWNPKAIFRKILGSDRIPEILRKASQKSTFKKSKMTLANGHYWTKAKLLIDETGRM